MATWIEHRRCPFLFMTPLRIGASGNNRLPVGIFDSRNHLLAAEPDRTEARRYVEEIMAAAAARSLTPRPFRRSKIDALRNHIALTALRAFR